MSILKIAVGVFLGVLAVFVLVKLPEWLETFYRERAQANARHALYTIDTPEDLIARCGTPLQEQEWSLPSEHLHLVRNMAYKTPSGEKAVLVTMVRVTEDGKNPIWGIHVDAGASESDWVGKVRALPCLANVGAKK